MSLRRLFSAFAFSLIPSASFSGMAFTATAGTQSYPDFKGVGFGYNFTAYYKFDEQVLLGVQSGQGVAGDASAVPILGAAYVRLPLGRVIMPVATGACGTVLADSGAGILWRVGGLFDIRNGKHSSLLLGSEYEHRGRRAGMVFRGGLLLEF